ncbi:MAG: Gfo/Idh/MocA family oxidoreductase [Planctomycetes bacterium]|nr:Gfo/Idh/MocA family oxidoreductase [Planctomycetota bacterium]
MAKKIKVGVIGAGQVSQLQHIPGAQQSPYAEVVAVADTSKARCKEAAEKFNIPNTFSDYKDLLAMDEIDAVSIALPNFLHYPVTMDALKAGKHAMCDKPMAMNQTEAKRMIDTAKKNRLVFMIGQNMRFSRENQLAKKAIESGKIGEPYHARCRLQRRNGIPRIGSWFTQKKYSGGGVLLDLGVHVLDLTLHLMGSFDVETVSGQVFSKFGRKGLGDGTWGMSERVKAKTYDVEDYATAFLRLKGGKTVILEVCWHAYLQPGHGIDICGTKGGLSTPPAKIFGEKKDIEPPIAPESAKVPLPTERLVHFIDCIVNKKKPICDPKQSLMIQKVLDAIYKSSKTGREVKIK